MSVVSETPFNFDKRVKEIVADSSMGYRLRISELEKENSRLRVKLERLEQDAAAPATETRLWTVDDVAAYLGVPKRTIYNWKLNGTGPPCSRVGKYLRYQSQDVKAWVKAPR